MGTIVVPLLLSWTIGFVFGWAKPVPVDFSRLRHPRRDMIWVAAAGPLMNLLLAVLTVLCSPLVDNLGGAAARIAIEFVQSFLTLNVFLAVFNMLPLPPMDGGRVAVGILPDRLAFPLARLEKYGMVILLALLIGLPWVGSLVGLNLSILSWVVVPIAERLIDVIASLAGHT
jgi:Zn-dependent protease